MKYIVDTSLEFKYSLANTARCEIQCNVGTNSLGRLCLSVGAKKWFN